MQFKYDFGCRLSLNSNSMNIVTNTGRREIECVKMLILSFALLKN